MENKIDKNLYKKAKEFDTEIQNFLKLKREEENSFMAKIKKEIDDFKDTKIDEKYKFCIENGGHFFKGFVGFHFKEYMADEDELIEEIHYHRYCALCDFSEVKYDLDENDIFDRFEWEY